jgi:hypothetical protein
VHAVDARVVVAKALAADKLAAWCAQLPPGSLVALEIEEARPPESFFLAWKTGAGGRALQWWRERLRRPLVPALLPRSA